MSLALARKSRAHLHPRRPASLSLNIIEPLFGSACLFVRGCDTLHSGLASCVSCATLVFLVLRASFMYMNARTREWHVSSQWICLRLRATRQRAYDAPGHIHWECESTLVLSSASRSFHIKIALNSTLLVYPQSVNCTWNMIDEYYLYILCSCVNYATLCRYRVVGTAPIQPTIQSKHIKQIYS